MMIKTIIIDDHALFNDGLRLILKESGKFEVIDQVYDSRQAYHKCYALMPDLVIVDYNMPHISGLEVVKSLKNLPGIKKLVIVSMYADRKETAMFEAEEIDGYLTKTTPAAELITALLRIISGEKLIVNEIEKKKPVKKDFFAMKHQLTRRELEILKTLKRGLTTEQIATELGLSYYTVETHRKNINQKMKFTSKNDLYDFLQKMD